ncbi:hypothetical protein CBOM_05674 [Ceraceosorus bombacis]|uniref:Uncharacterized protein n=1 Tax=Ceraceosorus bombacis TaxID=401625 RepID=A0A0P1BQS1_9BASI|nr:hypothetical protein CBOM_05674 [Ceraceosorus bombacis]
MSTSTSSTRARGYASEQRPWLGDAGCIDLRERPEGLNQELTIHDIRRLASRSTLANVSEDASSDPPALLAHHQI